MSTDTTLTGLVLRRWDQGESDRRLSVLTRERGRVLITAKGARKGGSRLASVSEPLALATFQVSEGKRSGFITQAQTLPGFRGLRQDYERLAVALAHVELVASIAQLGDADEDVFAATIHALKAIENHEFPVVAGVWAQLQLMNLEGILPGWTTCALDETELNEDPAWVSPMAGGYVSPGHSSEFPDRLTASAGVLIGLSKTAELAEPPPRLKLAGACMQVLHPFWLHHVGRDLPACVAMLQGLTL